MYMWVISNGTSFSSTVEICTIDLPMFCGHVHVYDGISKLKYSPANICPLLIYYPTSAFTHKSISCKCRYATSTRKMFKGKGLKHQNCLRLKTCSHITNPMHKEQESIQSWELGMWCASYDIIVETIDHSSLTFPGCTQVTKNNCPLLATEVTDIHCIM